MGETSVIDLIAGPVGETGTPHAGRRALGGDVRSVTLDGKKFTLYASPASESMSAPREEIQKMMVFLRENGGVHLLVYCMNALHPIKWIRETHRTVACDSITSPRTPAVAVIVGVSDVAQQDSWWSRTTDALADQGPCFNDHTFIRMMNTGTQAPVGGHISEICHALHVLILQNANSEMEADFQRGAFYKQRSIGNSFQSLLVMLARKASSHTSIGSKANDIVLVGEIGVGKSSLINLIAGETVAEVSSDTIACTRITAQYTLEEKGRIFRLHDTPGLVDPQMGDKPFVDPIDTIQQLIRTLGNGSGPDLILFCVDNTKPTAAFKRNYCIFYKFICGSKVPFALAVTKLEEGADQWWNQYGDTIQRYGVDRSRYIGLGREKRRPDPNADAERQLRESLLSFFTTCIDRQKNKTISLSLRSSMERATSFLRSRVSTAERILTRQCGLEEQTARELVNRIAVSKSKVHTRVSRSYVSLLNAFNSSPSIVGRLDNYACDLEI